MTVLRKIEFGLAARNRRIPLPCSRDSDVRRIELGLMLRNLIPLVLMTRAILVYLRQLDLGIHLREVMFPRWILIFLGHQNLGGFMRQLHLVPFAIRTIILATLHQLDIVDGLGNVIPHLDVCTVNRSRCLWRIHCRRGTLCGRLRMLLMALR